MEDTGSGLRLDNIYIYAKKKESKKWNLVLFRPTYTEVKVNSENNCFVFKTSKGKTILEQKFAALGTFSQGED